MLCDADIDSIMHQRAGVVPLTLAIACLLFCRDDSIVC